VCLGACRRRFRDASALALARSVRAASRPTRRRHVAPFTPGASAECGLANGRKEPISSRRAIDTFANAARFARVQSRCAA